MFKKTLSHPIYRKQESFIITDIIFYLPLVLKFQNTFIFFLNMCKTIFLLHINTEKLILFYWLNPPGRVLEGKIWKIKGKFYLYHLNFLTIKIHY